MFLVQSSTPSVACLKAFVLGLCLLCSPTQCHAQRPTVRLAFLHSSDTFFTAIKFLMQNLPNASSRTFLPDYDLVVEPMPFELGSGGASVRLVEALLSEQPFHAVIGPWTSIDCLDTVDLAAEAKILQITKGGNAEFSDRQRYPYVFRPIRSVDEMMIAWYYIVASNHWFSALCLLNDAPLIDLANALGHRYNVTSYTLLAESGEQWLTEAWQESAIDRLRTLRMRVMFTFLDTADDMYAFVCRVHRNELSGLQYFTNPAYSPEWYLEPRNGTVLGDCSPQEVYDAVGGYITVLHTPVAPGTVLFSQLFPAVNGNDESKRRMTCLPSFTPQSLFDSPELLGMAVGDDAVKDAATGAFFYGNVGPDMDMVCATWHAIHDVIYNKRYTLSEIERRESAVFEALVDSMSNTDLLGPAGRLTFYPNSPDPVVLYYILTQYAVPWRAEGRADLESVQQNVAVLAQITYPNGPAADPVITMFDEENDPLYWRDRSRGLGPKANLSHYPDCGLENAVLRWDRCDACPEGTAYDALLLACRTCPVGDFQNETGQSECFTALPGSYIKNILEPTEASPCPAGSECPQVGTVTPQPCSPGSFAASPGLSECAFCPEGTYQQNLGATECLTCELTMRGSTTATIASTTSSQCICPAGSFRPLVENSTCVVCLEGMICEEGSDMRNLQDETLTGPYPLVDVGYMTLRQAPLTVYLCKKEEQCPGGDPGSCAAHRDTTTVACGDCLDSAYEAGDVCEPCGDSDAVLIVVAIIIGIVVVILATLAINKDVHKTPAASFMIVAITGMLFTSLQALGVFSQMSVPWVEPVRTLLQLSQVFSFDLRLLKVSCTMGVNPIRAFALRQCMALAAIPCIGCTLLVKKYIPSSRFGRPQTKIFVELSNAIGTLFSVFFISIVISALNPFLCYRHPGGSGESVLSAPSLLCFESNEHTSMIVISVIALCLVPLPFMALCAYGVAMYPLYITSYDSRSFMHALRFLFFRYNPSRYYFQLILLTRSLIVCIIPAILRGQPSTQVLFMVLVLGIYIAVESQQHPWRSELCNPLDASMNVILLVMLTCGALFLRDTPQKEAVAGLTTAAVICLLLLTLVGIFMALLRRFVPRPFYDFFVCHHKAHAAAQARYLKMLLQVKRRTAQVFIDSDDLKQLDSLFDIVKSRVRHLVVFLTADTLKRPWCAGEIVSAFRTQLQITAVHTPSFLLPSEEQLMCLEDYVDSSGCTLGEYGIQWDNVEEAFRYFLSQVPQIHLNMSLPGTRRLDHIAVLLLKQRPTQERAPLLDEAQECSVLLSSDSSSDEANAAAGILIARIAKDIFQAFEQGICLVADYIYVKEAALRLTRQASVVVVILSEGCLDSMSFLTVLCELQRLQMESSSGAPTPLSVNTPGFTFPSPDHIDEACKTAGIHSLYGQDCSEDVKSFFKNISILLPTHASQEALDTQSDEIFRRIRQSVGVRKGLKTSASRGSGLGGGRGSSTELSAQDIDADNFKGSPSSRSDNKANNIAAAPQQSSVASGAPAAGAKQSVKESEEPAEPLRIGEVFLLDDGGAGWGVAV